MPVHPWWASYIRRGAAVRGLDPDAVLRVAGVEGLSGEVGDSGHAFGPFQQNDAGGVLTGKPGNHRQFAESRQGIDSALDAMVPLARGLRGEAAVAAIVRGYERPKDPEGEISRALGRTTPVTSGPTDLGLGAGTDLLQNNVSAAQDGAAAIRAQARQNLQDIATGAQRPTDALANIPALIRQLHSSVPKIDYSSMMPRAAASSLDLQAVQLARKYIGTKYTWGGTSPDTGFDCSGLVQTIWRSLGKSVPRTTYEQWDAGTPVDASQLKPGDAVFFTGSDPLNGKPGHEGLYIGEGKFIEAPGTGKQVRVSQLEGRSDYVGARRFG